ncbi:hypothetical protein RRG08_001071 [Elysia crispata]|uniref:Uncharacterized protein n=1 Tax=Elysia crispata TaxID=231223 RepID=A0AAE1E5A5_9GAST|nr:hypothetical protein RRG08_001071 [Elysia crispata]
MSRSFATAYARKCKNIAQTYTLSGILCEYGVECVTGRVVTPVNYLLKEQCCDRIITLLVRSSVKPMR